jgi:hypothetical protein|tara:strand:+ start:9628 stop:10683 length:1056 start_codon:yes stop_codon:yes gene_type:complete
MSIFKDFNIQPDNSLVSSDIVTNVKDTVSSGMWKDGDGSITAFYTSSTQSSSNHQYYLDVYAANPATDATAKSQFSVAYGHFNGSGSAGAKGVTGNRASAAIYRQLSNTLLGPNDDKFSFAASDGAHTTPEYVYAISIARQQLREKMDPGNWELHLSGSGTSTMKLIDDSGATTDPLVGQGGRVFNIVSGSIAGGSASTKIAATSQPGGGIGLFYPDMGLLILNGPVIASVSSASLSASVASNAEGGNVGKFFEKIEGGNYFQARREEVITSQHYFCRVPNKEFNFSSNPTFSSGSDGSFTVPTFYKNPKSFITQLGLYNDNNELLAIAKLSKPLLKSYSREAIIKVKLDF